MKNTSKKEMGNIGEEIASKYLCENGYQILERNFYTKHGELDIIAKQKDEIVFIEVKTRSNYAYGNPREAVTPIKQRHMYQAAKYYLYKKKQENAFTRFDVVEVYVEREKIRINHIKQILWNQILEWKRI